MKKTLLLLLFLVSLQTFAQNTTIKGTIINAASKEPLHGANISVKGKLIGTITDSKGNFTLNTSLKLPLELIISSLGFHKQEIQVTSADNQISVGMNQKNELMDEEYIKPERVQTFEIGYKALLSNKLLVYAQLSYRIPAIRSELKIGGSNLLNNQVYQAYGSPTIGAVYYVSIAFDQLLNR